MRFIRQFRSRHRQRCFIINPFVFGAGGGGPSGGLLGSYTANIWGGYALYQLWSSWTGSAIRVRRSSDNTEQDIGFSGTALDTAALATFVGANDAFVTKWYDQTGSANDLVQATQASQPKIVDAGTYIGEIIWDAIDDYLVTTNNSGTPTAFLAILAGRSRIGTVNTFETLFNQAGGMEQASAKNTNDSDYLRASTVNDATNNGNNVYDDAWTGDGATYAVQVDRVQGALASQILEYKNGSAQTETLSSGTVATGSFSAGAWYVGSKSTPGQYSRLAARAFLLYEATKSGADISAISDLVKPSVTTDGLTNFTTNLWSVCSLRRQISSYAGSAIRVRRSSDSTEQDIGFDATTHLLDTASLATFVGSGDGFVKTFYDQSGGGNNFTQATTTAQPRIMISGALQRGINFNGTSNFWTSANNSGTPTAFTAFVKGNSEATATAIWLEHNSANGANAAGLYRNNSTVTTAYVAQSYPTNTKYMDFSINIAGQVVAVKLDRTQSAASAVSKLYSGGANLTGSTNLNAGTITGSYTAAPWHFGARSGGSLWMTGDVETIAIYQTTVADADIERISRAIG